MALIISRRSSYCPNFATAPVKVGIANYSNYPITDIAILFGPDEKVIGRKDQVNAKGNFVEPPGYGIRIDPLEFGLKPDSKTSEVPATDEAKFLVDFTMEGHRFRLDGGKNVRLLDR